MLGSRCIRKSRIFLGLVTALLMSSMPGLAQVDQGRVSGSVKDTQGAVIPGATVLVNNEKTGDTRTVTTNATGIFVVPGLAPGTYTVTAKSEGLASADFKNVPVAVGQERTLNVVLSPAAVATEVTVDGGQMAAVDTSSARIGVNVGEREVSSVPLNGRQLSQLYLLSPGAVTVGGGTFDNIRFSGRANEENAIRYDGVEGSSIVDTSPGNLNGEISSGFRLQSSLENVQEFQVESNNYPAEYGTGTGGQISVITKSGTNSLHASLFEYFRNSSLDARNFFDRSTPLLPAGKSPLRMNQFGGSVGGPIQKDKFFFFASFEALRQRVGVPFLEQVPSAAARARAVASIQPALAAFPLGVSPTANSDLDVATLNGSSSIDETSGGIRLDYRLNDRYSLYARYFRDQGEAFLPTGVTGNGFQSTAVPQNAVLNLQQVLTPTLLNETKFGFNGNKTRTNGFVPDYPGLDLHAAAIIIGGATALTGLGGQGTASGLATPTGLVRANSSTNGRGQPYTNYTLSFVDSLSWIKGNHTTKYGLEIRPVRLETDRLGGATYSFSNLNDFLNNITSGVQFLGDVSAPSPFNGGATGMRNLRQTYSIFYAQDEWKLRPNLTMSYGLRYEYYSVLHETRNLDIVFDTVNGVLKPPDSQWYHSSPHNFGPRLAFSWSPDRMKGKTVARIGAGYYYGPGQTEDQLQPAESDRVSITFGANTPFRINPAQVIANYDINSPTLKFQPRAYAPGYTIPERVLSYTASVQQDLPGNMMLTVAFVGSQGRNLFLRGITNLITGVATNPTSGTAIITRQFGDRFAEIDFKTSGGTDSYNSMQTTLSRRFRKGLTTGLQWTWGHSIGNTAGSNEARTAQDSTNFRGERGNNNFDVRHSFNFNALYQIPIGRGRQFLSGANGITNAIIGGWEIGSVINARGGLPIEVGIVRPDTVYFDPRNGTYVNNPILVGGVPVTVAVINTLGGGNTRNIRRPDLIPGVDPYLHLSGDKRFYLNPAAFAMPAPGTYGNLARNALRGPGLFQLDMTLHKQFIVTEKTNLEFRAEFYNLFNRANFAVPPSSLANALGTGTNQIQPGQPFTAGAAGGAFGVINSTVEKAVGLGAQRQIQLSLRVNF
jgi:outer membrane receptor protein involved in Fe transport